ncbi:MAG: serine hydrolase domain-containing protein [Myxococcota bacterium]
MSRPHAVRSIPLALGLALASCLALAACAPLAPGAGPIDASTPEAVGLSSERLARLDRVLEGFVDDGRLPGFQLLVARDGRVVHERVYGAMDLEADRPLEADTIYRIYSMSKVITGAATMIAWEQGRFLLTDPISKYLPELGELSVMVWNEDGTTSTVPAEREITVLDLLRHTSGFSYHFLAPPPLGARYVEETITPGMRPTPGTTALGAPGTDQAATLADMVMRLGTLPLVQQPGSAWHYGINMDVLGRLIEVTDGRPFPVFLEEEIFTRIGMPDAGFHVAAEDVDRFAALYGATQDGGLALVDPPRTSAYLEPPAMPGGGGGLVATASDYMRFALMLLRGGELDGERLLSPRTVELMTANHLSPVDFGARPLAFGGSDDFANGGLGLGFGLTGSVVVEPALTGLPVSKGTFGWGGAASTYFWIDPAEDIAVVFMTQLVPSNAYRLRAHLLGGVNAAIVD